MIALVALAGGLGAVLRFVVDGVLRARLGVWATTVVNVSGSFALGLVVAAAGDDGTWHDVLGTGLLGGYTTFSTASVELLRLVEGRRPVAALAYGGGTLVACVAAAALGLAVG
ncbi:MAG: CrcB family protein [Aeromicrobium erythreum]